MDEHQNGGIGQLNGLEFNYRAELLNGKSWRELLERETNHVWKSTGFRIVATYLFFSMSGVISIMGQEFAKTIVWFVFLFLFSYALLDVYYFSTRTTALAKAFASLNPQVEQPSTRTITAQFFCLNMVIVIVTAAVAFSLTRETPVTNLFQNLLEGGGNMEIR